MQISLLEVVKDMHIKPACWHGLEGSASTGSRRGDQQNLHVCRIPGRLAGRRLPRSLHAVHDCLSHEVSRC